MEDEGSAGMSSLAKPRSSPYPEHRQREEMSQLLVEGTGRETQGTARAAARERRAVPKGQ